MGHSSFVRRLSLFAVVAVLTAAAQSSGTSPSAIPTQIPGQNALLLGVAWYPEQWPESRWEEDLRLMESANIKVVRIAEFAWSRMEPSEGKFDLDWLDRAISLAAKHHIVSVLGTPTAAPPAWLTQKYPDTLRVESNGQRSTHGNRAHGSVSSPRYRELCRRIAAQMARRFGHNPNVAGWQIDNEYGYAQMSYDDLTRADFQEWLKAKYKTLDNLNDRWTTQYWSQVYDAWSQIPIPLGGHNPGLMLEWKRFVTATWRSYQKNQIDAIRQFAEPRQFFTGNLMGFFDGFDHYAITEDLTFGSWDDYVGTGHVDAAANGITHDLNRGFKRRNFWVMETQPGAVNWASVNNFLNRGESRAMAWQAVGHGADDVNYWQWRSALNGQEEIHGVLVGPDGAPVPFYDEASRTGREFAQTEGSFRGTTPVSEVALLYSYDSHWAIQFQRHTDKYDDLGLLRDYYRALYPLAQSVDVVSAYAPLDGYKLVVAPSLNVLPKDLADHLLAYVRNGGHLVLGPRSGMKDEFNALLPQRQPGFLVDALAGRVEQYYALEKDVPISGILGDGTAVVWAEQLKALAPDAEVLLTYGRSNGWLDNQPAVMSHAYGKGRITYIGAVLDGTLTRAVAQWMTEKSDVHRVFGAVPDGVEVSRRVGPGKQVFVLVNYAQENREVVLPRAMQALLARQKVDRISLPPYGVEILAEDK